MLGCRLVEADQDSDLLCRRPSWRLRPGPPVLQSPWNVLSCVQTGIGWSWQSWASVAADESVQDLGHGRQVGDRPVVYWLWTVEPGLLQQWKHLRYLVSCQKLSLFARCQGPQWQLHGAMCSMMAATTITGQMTHLLYCHLLYWPEKLDL